MLYYKFIRIVPVCLLMTVSPFVNSVHGELVGYWNFDGNVEDQSGGGNHGELVDATYSDNVPAVIGSGMSVNFEADTDHVFVENADGNLDSEEFTVAMFIFDRGQEGALERLTSRESDTFETAINVHPPFSGQGEYAYFSGAGGGWQWGEEIPPLEQWQHVAYVANADEETMTIYVDGELTYESPDPWVVFPSGFMHIGNRWNDVEGFDGMIDDLAIWDEVLSDDDIKTLSQVGVATFLSGGIVDGDFNRDGKCDAADIDALSNAIRAGEASADVNGDGSVNADDHKFLVKDLKNSFIGDSNLDGEFNSSDFVAVFQEGKYETNQPAGWAQGDWNGDGLFNSTDFVAAFQDGGYEMGPKQAAVPEPSSIALFCLALLGFTVSRRRS